MPNNEPSNIGCVTTKSSTLPVVGWDLNIATKLDGVRAVTALFSSQPGRDWIDTHRMCWKYECLLLNVRPLTCVYPCTHPIMQTVLVKVCDRHRGLSLEGTSVTHLPSHTHTMHSTPVSQRTCERHRQCSF